MTPGGRLLASLAQAIPTPVLPDGGQGEVFATVPIPESPCHLLGRDVAGLVAVLISIDKSFPLGPFAPIRLENLVVSHAARCVVSYPGEPSIADIFSVVRCQSDDLTLTELFIDVMASVAKQFPKPPPASEAVQVIDRVIRLFRDLAKPSERTVQGLWAEMFVIASAAEPVTVARSWRNATFDTADFATAQQRLEVKSTTGTIRSHSFSAEQLRTPPGTFGVVASLMCQRSAGGVSVGELWSIVRRQVASEPGLLLSIDGTVAATLGNSWKESLSVRYDWDVAKESLRFYSMADVPAVGVQSTPDVSEVRFRSNLSRCASLDRYALRRMGSLLGAVAQQVEALV